MNRAIILCFAASFAVGCHKENTLGGTLSAQYDFKYDDVRAYWNGPELIVAYEVGVDVPANVQGFGSHINNQVLRLMINSKRVALEPHTDIALTADPNSAAASIERYVLSSSNNGQLVQDEPLPDIVSGNIHFDTFTRKEGNALRGHFSAVFVDGRTAQGNFDAPLSAP